MKKFKFHGVGVTTYKDKDGELDNTIRSRHSLYVDGEYGVDKGVGEEWFFSSKSSITGSMMNVVQERRTSPTNDAFLDLIPYPPSNGDGCSSKWSRMKCSSCRQMTNMYRSHCMQRRAALMIEDEEGME